MKILFNILIIVILLATITYSQDMPECGRFQDIQDIPCKIVSSFKPAAGCVQPISIYLENGTSIINSSWKESVPFCNYIWNITAPIETYAYNSSVEDGVITLELKDNMLSIVFTFLAFITVFLGLGTLNIFRRTPALKRILTFASFFLAFTELLILLAMVWINNSGNSINSLLQINFIIMLILGGGMALISIFMFVLSMVNISDVLVDDKNKWDENDFDR